MIRHYFLHSSDESNEDDQPPKVYKPRCFRLHAEQVELILNATAPHLQHQTISKCLSLREQLLLCLHWIGNEGQ
ncbi:hypothetical protein PR048_021809 [Dryococelus australis]|uniref:Uncharacterized protein n=1 Tax=Dryococelus australis TaxID=614101 RepID=A0ABQ9GZB2_9NEOP|nr:hypothetical protein PR048_021809 [Dryococelus australis]